MSTTPVVPVTIQSEVSALAHRHLTLTYGLVGTLILLLVLMGVGGYLGLRSFDNALARQEVRDAQYQQDRQKFLDTLQVNDAQRTADATKIAQLEAQIKQRDSKPLPPAEQDALKPTADTQTVAKGLQSAYSSLPDFGVIALDQAGSITLGLTQAQAIIVVKEEDDRLKGDLKDTQAVVDLQKQANLSLTKDLGVCTDLNTKAQADIAGFKKLAVRSRWQKFLGGAKTVLLMAGSAYLGHKI